MINYPSIYRKWIIISALIHAVIIIFVLYIHKRNTSHLILPTSILEEIIDVDIVDLPNILKKDLRDFRAGKIPNDNMILPDIQQLFSSKLKAIEKLKRSIKKESYLEKIKIIKGLKTEVSSDMQSLKNIDPQYFNTMRKLIRRYWKIPNWFDTEGLKTLILVKISQSGDISKIEIIEPSGNIEFDNLAINAIESASPFPDSPLSIKDILENGIILSFP